MPQHDLVVNNASGAAVRADLNDALAALGSTMKGPNAPPAPIAGMLWLDDDTPSATVWTLKLYDGADWLSIGTFNVSTNTFTPANAVPLSNGALTGALLAPAGSAGAPAYSFSGDADTGIFSVGSGAVGISSNGSKILEVFQGGGGSGAFLDNPAGSAGINLALRALNASASVAPYASVSMTNEFGIPVANVTSSVNTDGSAEINFQVTPPGARNADRRVSRLQLGATGAISLFGNAVVSGDMYFNSGYGSAALAYGVRAWVNFNGTGTVAIRGSGGVTSITDNGTGDYAVNFNFTMPDANYAPSINVSESGVAGGAATEAASIISLATTSFRFACKYSYSIFSSGAVSSRFDPSIVSVIVVR